MSSSILTPDPLKAPPIQASIMWWLTSSAVVTGRRAETEKWGVGMALNWPKSFTSAQKSHRTSWN